MSTVVAPRSSRVTETLLSDYAYPQQAHRSLQRAAPTMDEEFSFVVPFGQGVFVVQSAPPPWIVPLWLQISDLGSLPPNWNSYGAQPIKPEIAVSAMKLLLELLAPSDPFPAVVPTSRGGILLEWHEGGLDLELDIRAPNMFHLSIEEGQGSAEFDNADIALIAEKLNCLRQRLK